MRRPRFIAEQARDATGPLGRFIAFIMARETWTMNRRAIEALQIETRDHVLDVGCGHGRSLGALAALAPAGRIVGADPSALMVSIAHRRNRDLVRVRRVEAVAASAEALPFPDVTFDKALCVHVVYFWQDLDTALREIARVLKPGARFALVFRTSADEAGIKSFPADVYRFPALDEMVDALEAAGFSVGLLESIRAQQFSGPILLVAVKQGATGTGNAPELDKAGAEI